MFRKEAKSSDSENDMDSDEEATERLKLYI